MRRINSEFRTQYISEEGQKLTNRDYFGFVEMDDYACYILADSLDGELETNSARFVVESLIRSFVEGPTMNAKKLKHFMNQAHKELLKQRGGMHLKASVTMVVTDYKKLCYCYVGNSRFYLIRNARVLIKTKDQSLTQNLLQEEKITLDQAAAHEERNNLYSFLGDRGQPEILVSKKVPLENGDSFALFTRGAWENLSEEEFLEISKDAKEPQEILEKAEDIILGKQETEEVDNYSLAVTFVDKVYQSPKKKITLKKVLLIALPILLLAGGISLGLYLKHKSVKNKEDSLERHLASGEEYLKYDNYLKASEDYGEAKKLADSLKKKKISKEADQYKKLAEQILLSDEAMTAGDYKKAQSLYLKARDLSKEAGNVGKKYIDAQLKQTLDYIDVFDLMEIGQKKEEYGDLRGAIDSYRKARDKAAALYFSEGKDEALKKQAALEEKMEKDDQKTAAAAAAAKQESEAAKQVEEESQQAEEEKAKKEEEEQLELENKQKLNDQKNAIELENKANELLAEGKYESAVTYYQTAQAIYVRLEMTELADGINGKIKAAKTAIKEAKKETAESENTGEDGPGMSRKKSDK
ncbi:PP2C family protein-serine/threonine phosphatase [Lacrimispora sp. JR3]|uniref:PP2C family protein-serine/threonine phosphatase n=1 Tax=Lacrimispora sinapis TaxID=3111456 RepID=UPI00374878BA